MKGWRTSPPSKVEENNFDIRSFLNPVSVDHIDFLLRPDTIDLKTYYFVAPQMYIGNKVTSYGGVISWNLEVNLESTSSTSMGGNLPDLILVGGRFQPPLAIGSTLSDNLAKKGLEGSVKVVVKLEERFFRKLAGASIVVGTSVSHTDFMEVLITLKAILIRGSYSSNPVSISISQVSMDCSVEGNATNDNLALSIEKCQCPTGYSGTSCEICSVGYTRKIQPDATFKCVPCMCGGRSDECDRETGQCLNCRDNFIGPACERCKETHFYDSRSDTCQLCTCPGNSEEESFATNCTVDNRGRLVLCECKPGYAGSRCDQ